MFFIVMFRFVYLGVNSSKEQDDLMKVKDFAKAVKIGTATAYEAIRKGKIKYVQKRRGLGFVKLIPRSELDKFKEVIKK